jgi:alpha-1,6-mannosyltransferase
MNGVPTRFVILALLLETLFLLLLYAGKADKIVSAIVILLLAGAVFVTAAYFAHKLRAQHATPLFRFIIAAAIVFRMTVWPLTFPSTDDAYRYRWEGKLQAFGGNPYEVRPRDPQWAQLRDSTYKRIGLKDFKAGYGPAWELVCAATYRVVSVFVADEWRQAFWFKVPAALADLGIIAAVAGLLRVYGMPITHVLIYAWSPLPVWEFWANGHNDALAVLAAVLAMWFAAGGRPWHASSAVAVGAALKFWPVILIPALLRGGLRVRHILLCAPAFLLFAVPYWTGVSENVRFMTGFVGGWRNNDSLFGLILWAFRDQYDAKYAAFTFIIGMTLFFAIRARDTAMACLSTIVALLLIASNCHPWYLTWFVPLLALYPSAGLLLWTAVVPLFYSVWPGWVATGIWDGVTPMRWMVYVPVLLLIAARALYGLRNAQRTGKANVSRACGR